MARVLRMRVFAGPNGSGKSTMYDQVKRTKVNGRPVDLGYYLNPDLIAKELREKRRFDLGIFEVDAGKDAFHRFAHAYGLLGKGLTQVEFSHEHSFQGEVLCLRHAKFVDQYAQLVTAFLCEELIKHKRKFSFETVFSHSSKLELIQKANDAGFKVYLYFIATNDPEINKDRVKTRVKKGGHNVPAERIESRYYRSLEQLLPAVHMAYHAFMFDNSGDQPVMFAEFKKAPEPTWNFGSFGSVPYWFIEAYMRRVDDDGMRDAINQVVLSKAIHGLH
jgi:predicted ABC-type ATPase